MYIFAFRIFLAVTNKLAVDKKERRHAGNIIEFALNELYLSMF